MLQLHLSDRQFFCLLMCALYWRFYGNWTHADFSTIQNFSFKKMKSKMSSTKWQPFCSGFYFFYLRGQPLEEMSQGQLVSQTKWTEISTGTCLNNASENGVSLSCLTSAITKLSTSLCLGSKWSTTILYTPEDFKIHQKHWSEARESTSPHKLSLRVLRLRLH